MEPNIFCLCIDPIYVYTIGGGLAFFVLVSILSSAFCHKKQTKSEAKDTDGIELRVRTENKRADISNYDDNHNNDHRWSIWVSLVLCLSAFDFISDLNVLLSSEWYNIQLFYASIVILAFQCVPFIFLMSEPLITAPDTFYVPYNHINHHTKRFLIWLPDEYISITKLYIVNNRKKIKGFCSGDRLSNAFFCLFVLFYFAFSVVFGIIVLICELFLGCVVSVIVAFLYIIVFLYFFVLFAFLFVYGFLLYVFKLLPHRNVFFVKWWWNQMQDKPLFARCLLSQDDKRNEIISSDIKYLLTLQLVLISECFFETMPQFALQLYNSIKLGKFSTFSIISITISSLMLFSLTWKYLWFLCIDRLCRKDGTQKTCVMQLFKLHQSFGTSKVGGFDVKSLHKEFGDINNSNIASDAAGKRDKQTQYNKDKQSQRNEESFWSQYSSFHSNRNKQLQSNKDSNIASDSDGKKYKQTQYNKDKQSQRNEESFWSQYSSFHSNKNKQFQSNKDKDKGSESDKDKEETSNWDCTIVGDFLSLFIPWFCCVFSFVSFGFAAYYGFIWIYTTSRDPVISESSVFDECVVGNSHNCRISFVHVIIGFVVDFFIDNMLFIIAVYYPDVCTILYLIWRSTVIPRLVVGILLDWNDLLTAYGVASSGWLCYQCFIYIALKSPNLKLFLQNQLIYLYFMTNVLDKHILLYDDCTLSCTVCCEAFAAFIGVLPSLILGPAVFTHAIPVFVLYMCFIPPVGLCFGCIAGPISDCFCNIDDASFLKARIRYAVFMVLLASFTIFWGYTIIAFHDTGAWLPSLAIDIYPNMKLTIYDECASPIYYIRLILTLL